MFPMPMIDNLIARFSPHVITARDESRAWARAITDRLDLIADGVNQDAGETERRIRLRPTLQVIPANGAPMYLEDIPPGESWHLEYAVALTEDATPNAFLLLDTAAPDVFSAQAAGGVVYALPFTAAGQWVSGGGNGLVIPGGTALYMGTSKATPGTHVSAYLQFRIHAPAATRPNVGAGFRAQTPDRTDGAQEVQDTQRHVGSWHPGLPVFGPSAGRVNHGASS